MHPKYFLKLDVARTYKISAPPFMRHPGIKMKKISYHSNIFFPYAAATADVFLSLCNLPILEYHDTSRRIFEKLECD